METISTVNNITKKKNTITWCERTSWRTIGCKERSFRAASRAGIASASCIWPNAKAASWASKLEESLVAEEVRRKKKKKENNYLIYNLNLKIRTFILQNKINFI